MAKAVLDELAAERPRNHFTVGIADDVSRTSLAVDAAFSTEDADRLRAVFYGLGSRRHRGGQQDVGEDRRRGDRPVRPGLLRARLQEVRVGDRLPPADRVAADPLHLPDRPGQATFVACHQFHFLDRMDVLGRAAPGATFLLNSPWPADQVWDHLPVEVQREIIDKGSDLWVVDAARVAREAGMGHRINTVMQPCFFALSGVLPREEAIAAIKAWVEKAFSRRGEEVVARNFAAVDGALGGAAAGGGARPRRPAPATAARPCPSRPPTSSSGSPPGCWKATATCCRSAPCPSTVPSRPGRPGGRSGRWPPRSPSGTRRSASTAASAPSSARTRPSAPRCSAPRPWRAPRTGSHPRISAPGTCPG